MRRFSTYIKYFAFISVCLVSATAYCSDNNPSDDADIKKELVVAAIKAREKAYAPYSNYKVGAAILTAEGKIILGSNVENASYGLTTCAERNAVFKAVTDGIQNFSMIAVVTKDGGFPCGACRQVLNEFSRNVHVIVANEKGKIVREVNLADLLPEAFGPQNLK